MCFGSSNKTTTSQQQSSTDINPTFKPYYEDLARRAKEASLQVSGQPYTGRFVAGPTGQEQQGVNVITNAVNTALPASQAAQTGAIGNSAAYSGVGGDVLNLAKRTLSGEFVDPNNPILRGAIEGATSPILRNLDRALVRSDATAAAQGAYGGSRQAQINNMIRDQGYANANEAAARITNDWFNRERVAQTQAPQMAAQAGALEGLPSNIINQATQGTVGLGTTLGQAGEVGRGLSDLDIKNALLAFQEQQAAPNRPLVPYAQLLGTVPTTTTTTGQGTQTTPGPGGFTQFLQGALGIGSLAAAIPW